MNTLNNLGYCMTNSTDKSANLHTSQSTAAEMLQVSTRSVATAAKISRDAPAEIFEAVKAGTSERGEPEGAADD